MNLGKFTIQKNQYLFLFFLIVLAFSLRVFNVWNRQLGVDEALTINVTKSFSSAIGFSNSDFYPPLSYAFMVPLFAFFGVLGTRIVFALIGTLAVAIFYFFARNFFTEKNSLLSTLLFALNPLNVFYAVQLRQYIVLLFLALTALYFFTRLLQKFSWRNLAIFSLACVLMGYIHYVTWFYVLSMILYTIVFLRRDKHFKHFLMGFLVIFFFLVPLIPLAFSQFENYSGSHYYSKSVSLNPLNYPYVFYKLAVGINISSALEFFPLFIAIAPLVLFFVLIGMNCFFRENKTKTGFVLYSFLFSVLFLFITSLKAPMLFSFRYIFPLMPLFVLFLSRGIFSIERKKAMLFLIAIIVLWFLGAFYYYMVSMLPDWNALIGL